MYSIFLKRRLSEPTSPKWPKAKMAESDIHHSSIVIHEVSNETLPLCCNGGVYHLQQYRSEIDLNLVYSEPEFSA